MGEFLAKYRPLISHTHSLKELGELVQRLQTNRGSEAPDPELVTDWPDVQSQLLRQAGKLAELAHDEVDRQLTQITGWVHSSPDKVPVPEEALSSARF